MVTAIIIAKNEGKIIRKCIASLKWCQEIIVIDNNSTDDTVIQAKKDKVKIHEYSAEDDFSALRNFGLKKATSDWVFFVDADEIVSKELADEIYMSTSQFVSSVNAYYMYREDFMWGKKIMYGDAGNKKLLRLALADKGEWVGKVHEVWEILGDKAVLKNKLAHYPHQSVAQFLNEINSYTTIRAQELFAKKIKVNFIQIFLFPFMKFVNNYLVKLGFRDGIAGMIHALMMSFHSFLVRAKLWQLQKDN